jgi:hypothetical protein
MKRASAMVDEGVLSQRPHDRGAIGGEIGDDAGVQKTTPVSGRMRAGMLRLTSSRVQLLRQARDTVIQTGAPSHPPEQEWATSSRRARGRRRIHRARAA